MTQKARRKRYLIGEISGVDGRKRSNASRLECNLSWVYRKIGTRDGRKWYSESSARVQCSSGISASLGTNEYVDDELCSMVGGDFCGAWRRDKGNVGGDEGGSKERCSEEGQVLGLDASVL